MSRGAPDWSNVVKQAEFHRIDDLGELAARLTHLASFDRTGEVLWWDNFADGLVYWTSELLGTNSSAALAVRESISSPFVVELVGGTDLSGFARITRSFPIIELSRLGLDVVYAAPILLGSLAIQIDIQHGTYSNQYGAKLDTVDKTLSYLNSGGTYTVCGLAANVASGSSVMNRIKLVSDEQAASYVRIICNDQTYLLPGIDCNRATGTVGYQIKCSIAVVHHDLFEPTIDVKNVVLTQNEN